MVFTFPAGPDRVRRDVGRHAQGVRLSAVRPGRPSSESDSDRVITSLAARWKPATTASSVSCRSRDIVCSKAALSASLCSWPRNGASTRVAQDVGELVGQRVHVPVDRLGRLLHRVDRDVELDQLQRDVEGRQRLVALAVHRGSRRCSRSRWISSSPSLRRARVSSWRRVIDSRLPAPHEVSIARCRARSSTLASTGTRPRYFSIADSVKPWSCSARISSSRARCSGCSRPSGRDATAAAAGRARRSSGWCARSCRWRRPARRRCRAPRRGPTRASTLTRLTFPLTRS